MNIATDEQTRIINTILSKVSDGEIVAVNAVAGSGKTTTAVQVVKALKPSSGFYTTFNKAIIEEARTKFPKNIECKTIHSLAYKFVKLHKELKELSYSDIKERIRYEDKQAVMKCIGGYFRSQFITIEEYFDHICDSDTVKKVVLKYVTEMEDGEINPTFDFMLKTLHILLVKGAVDISYDLVILDECQDTVPVTLEIFKLIKAKKKLMLGDTYQNIYGFLNTVNGFELLADQTVSLQLTQSFRCSERIAGLVQKYGKTYLSPDFVYRGNPDIDDFVDGSISYQSRTNATIVKRIHEMQCYGNRYSLTRPIGEIFALPLAMINAASGKPVYHAQYKFLADEFQKFDKMRDVYDNFYAYLLDFFHFDPAIEGAVRILTYFNRGRVNIFDVMKKAKETKPDPRNILTTVHAFKGLETDVVYIEDNLNNMLDNVTKKQEYTQADLEDLNLYYVAITRARTQLDNAIYAI